MLRIHGGLPELLRVHLAQAFVALDRRPFLTARAPLRRRSPGESNVFGASPPATGPRAQKLRSSFPRCLRSSMYSPRSHEARRSITSSSVPCHDAEVGNRAATGRIAISTRIATGSASGVQLHQASFGLSSASLSAWTARKQRLVDQLTPRTNARRRAHRGVAHPAERSPIGGQRLAANVFARAAFDARVRLIARLQPSSVPLSR